jgi:hypothetical protein
MEEQFNRADKTHLLIVLPELERKAKALDWLETRFRTSDIQMNGTSYVMIKGWRSRWSTLLECVEEEMERERKALEE